MKYLPKEGSQCHSQMQREPQPHQFVSQLEEVQDLEPPQVETQTADEADETVAHAQLSTNVGDVGTGESPHQQHSVTTKEQHRSASKPLIHKIQRRRHQETDGRTPPGLTGSTSS